MLCAWLSHPCSPSLKTNSSQDSWTYNTYCSHGKAQHQLQLSASATREPPWLSSKLPIQLEICELEWPELELARSSHSLLLCSDSAMLCCTEGLAHNGNLVKRNAGSDGGVSIELACAPVEQENSAELVAKSSLKAGRLCTDMLKRTHCADKRWQRAKYKAPPKLNSSYNLQKPHPSDLRALRGMLGMSFR